MKNLVYILILFQFTTGFAQAQKSTHMKEQAINTILTSQYKAALQMLSHAIAKIPNDEWNTEEYDNPNWQIAYHAINFTKLYLCANMESFTSWENAIPGAESLGGSSSWENATSEVPLNRFHTKQELLGYITDIRQNLESDVAALPLQENSGFEWYPYSRMELHLNNIRHIQHHTAQLIERLKAKGITGFPWAIDGNPAKEW